MWALAGPGAGAESRGEGRAGAETDQHRGGAALEKRLQHQRRPPAGRQHLPLGLFCVTLQAWYQPRQVKHSQARPAGDRLPSHLTVHTEPSEAETAGTPKEHPIQPVHWRVEPGGAERALGLLRPHSRTRTGSPDSNSSPLQYLSLLPQKHYFWLLVSLSRSLYSTCVMRSKKWKIQEKEWQESCKNPHASLLTHFPSLSPFSLLNSLAPNPRSPISSENLPSKALYFHWWLRTGGCQTRRSEGPGWRVNMVADGIWAGSSP